MSKYDVTLRPVYFASVSGGKDSLYMLGLILSKPDKYPLDYVVHFELEIDFPWVENVVNLMEEKCNKAGVKFIRIKPRYKWEECYKNWGYPTRTVRWCNKYLKLDCVKQLEDWCKSQNCRPVSYIGFCADETKRFKYDVGLSDLSVQRNIYPLAEEGINENFILEWAKDKDIFDDWYKLFKRQGCIMCPMSTMKERAYIKIKYPDLYNYYMDLVIKSEEKYNTTVFQGNKKYDGRYQDRVINEKWIPKVMEELKAIEC